jgi:hypothetical protein
VKPLSPAVLCVLCLCAAACQRPALSEASSPTDSATDKEIAALKAEVQSLKGKVPTASVTMASVGFHWSNLWFAGQSRNWPLAAYYYNEARNHMLWLIRVNPAPLGPDKKPVDLKGIFDALDTTTFAAVKTAIANKDGAQFQTTYKAALESCYSCHQSVGRPYLRMAIPKILPQTIVTLDPQD